MIDISSYSSRLERDDEGIWRTAEQRGVSYPEGGHDACFAVESQSFWFRHRNACIVAAVQNFPPPSNGPIFDIGGGNGFVALALTNAGFEVVLVEPGYPGARHARQRGLPVVVCATTDAARFRPRSLPAIGLFDVIEHIENDAAFVGSMASLLTPGGRLYATVPTYSALWSNEDIAAGHYRRYTASTFRSLLESAGFRIDFCTYFFRFLPLPIAVLRSLPYRLGFRPRAESASSRTCKHHDAGRGARLVQWFQDSEVSRISAGHVMPFGSSCLVVATIR